MYQKLTSLVLYIALAVLVKGAETVKTTGLVPLSEIASKIDPDKPDFAQLGYFGVRSAALYSAIGEYTKNSAKDEKGRKAAEILLRRAEVFYLVGRFIELEKNQKTEAYHKEQFSKFMEIYVESMKEYKMLNNSVFSPLVDEDFKAASSMFKVFESLQMVLLEQAARSK